MTLPVRTSWLMNIVNNKQKYMVKNIFFQFITSKPHVAGTPGDFEMAMFVKEKVPFENTGNS